MALYSTNLRHGEPVVILCERGVESIDIVVVVVVDGRDEEVLAVCHGVLDLGKFYEHCWNR